MATKGTISLSPSGKVCLSDEGKVLLCCNEVGSSLACPECFASYAGSTGTLTLDGALWKNTILDFPELDISGTSAQGLIDVTTPGYMRLRNVTGLGNFPVSAFFGDDTVAVIRLAVGGGTPRYQTLRAYLSTVVFQCQDPAPEILSAQSFGYNVINYIASAYHPNPQWDFEDQPVPRSLTNHWDGTSTNTFGGDFQIFSDVIPWPGCNGTFVFPDLASSWPHTLTIP